jgi:hypothetical protein
MLDLTLSKPLYVTPEVLVKSGILTDAYPSIKMLFGTLPLDL